MYSEDAEKRRSDARRAGRKADHKSPLRRVIAVVEVPLGKSGIKVDREFLECGHIHRPSSSWHGSYAGEADRRRCKKCARGAADDFGELDASALLDYLNEHQPATASGERPRLTRHEVAEAPRERLLAIIRHPTWRQAREAKL